MYLNREKVIKMGLLASILVVSVAIVLIILTGINQFRLSSQVAGISQVTNLSHLLVRQQANLFSLMLSKQTGNEELSEALDNFANEPFVIDANLYNTTGSLVAKSNNAKDLKQILAAKEINTQQIVEPIFAQENLIGFLRVTFDAQYAQAAKGRVNLLFNQLYGQLIILVLVGLLVASSIHYFFRRRVVHQHLPVKTTRMVANEVSPAKRFHSRRRSFARK